MICKCGGGTKTSKVTNASADLEMEIQTCVACGRVSGELVYAISTGELIGRGVSARMAYGIVTGETERI